MIDDFLFIGHRGTRSIFDENTILAFTKAIEYGATHIEFDVRKTKDKKLVILHDSNLDRTTNGTGLLKNFTYNEIRALRTVKNHCSVPLLTEVLRKFQGKIKFMIELKDKDLTVDIEKIIKGDNLALNSVISGKYLKDLLIIKKKIPGIKICYNISKGLGLSLAEYLKMEPDTINKYKFDMISLRSNLISQKFIEKCHENKIMALSWDFQGYRNPLRKINYLINKGIDGILFDDHTNIKKIKMKLLNLEV